MAKRPIKPVIEIKNRKISDVIKEVVVPGGLNIPVGRDLPDLVRPGHPKISPDADRTGLWPPTSKIGPDIDRGG